MLVDTLLHAVVLGIIVLVVTKGQNRPDAAILLGLPLGLGLLSGMLFLFLDVFSIPLSLGVAVFALRWAFDLSTKQSLTVTGCWGVWQVVYAMI